MAQHVITLPCIGTAYIDSYNRYNNYVGSVMKIGENHRYKSYAKFNDSALPVRKKIISIKLKYYVEQVIPDTVQTHSEYYIRLGLKSNDININTVTYDNNNLISTQIRKVFPTTVGYLEDEVIEKATKLAVFNSYAAWDNSILSGYGSANPPLLVVTYDDIPPDAPTPIDPIGSYIDRGSVIRFNWRYNSLVGGTQKGFDLLWSTNGTVWTTVSQITANNFYDIPANTLPGGNVSWKVKTYNEYDEVSQESSTSTFYAIGAPPPPTILGISTNNSRPTVTWSATSQQIYQVQILLGSNIVYDSGSFASMSQFHEVNTFLDDGTYIAKVRIKNEFDLFSNWTSSSFTISVPKPTKPILDLSQNIYCVLATSNVDDNNYLLLYRGDIDSSNYICVAKSTTNTIMDYTVESNKQYKYFIRAVSNINAYMDSDIKIISAPSINKSLISAVSDLSNIFEIKYNLNERPVKNITISTPYVSNYYSGRKYPVAEYSEHLSSAITVSFFIKSSSDLQLLNNIVNKKDTILYRDGRRKFYGNTGGLNITDNYDGYIVNISINQTDYTDALEV
jgi:hypothetical protein